MENINAILLVLQVLLSISLITLVLLQHGKGADAGAAFGSGASATVFGAKGSGNFMTKATSIVAMLFFATCMGLAYMAANREGPSSIMESVIDGQPLEQTTTILQDAGTSDLPPLEKESESAASDTNLPPTD